MSPELPQASRQYKDKINFAGLLENQIRLILSSSKEGKISDYCQCVDDFSDTLEPYKDAIYFDEIRTINSWKNTNFNKIKKKNIGKNLKDKEIKDIQYLAKRKIYKELLKLASRSGYMPVQFISTSLDFKGDEEEVEEVE